MATYDEILEILGARCELTKAPEELTNQAIDFWLSKVMASIVRELGDQGHEEEKQTLSYSYNEERTEVIFTWEQGGMEQSSTAPLKANMPFLPGRP